MNAQRDMEVLARMWTLKKEILFAALRKCLVVYCDKELRQTVAEVS